MDLSKSEEAPAAVDHLLQNQAQRGPQPPDSKPLQSKAEYLGQSGEATVDAQPLSATGPCAHSGVTVVAVDSKCCRLQDKIDS